MCVQVHVVKIVLLYNPKSGAKKGEKLAHQAQKLFHNHGVDVEMMPLQRKGHAKEICKVLLVFSCLILCFFIFICLFVSCLMYLLFERTNTNNRLSMWTCIVAFAFLEVMEQYTKASMGIWRERTMQDYVYLWQSFLVCTLLLFYCTIVVSGLIHLTSHYSFILVRLSISYACYPQRSSFIPLCLFLSPLLQYILLFIFYYSSILSFKYLIKVCRRYR